jgi:hypothetical protein
VFARHLTGFAGRLTGFASRLTPFARRLTVFAEQLTAFAGRLTVFAERLTAFAGRLTAFARRLTVKMTFHDVNYPSSSSGSPGKSNVATRSRHDPAPARLLIFKLQASTRPATC